MPLDRAAQIRLLLRHCLEQEPLLRREVPVDRAEGDVGCGGDVALGTVYRYFSSKERLLLEAMAEQQSDLRGYVERHPPADPTAAARVTAVLKRANRALRSHPDVTAAMVRAIGSAQPENADIVRRVTEIMTAIITSAIHGTDVREANERELRVARILMQVWLSSLNGWVCGVDGPERVDEDLAAAAQLLLDSPLQPA